jgi:hypothetical protein
MRRIFAVGLAALFILSTTVIPGCGSDNKAEIPKNTIDLPKNGPVPAGGGGKKAASAPGPSSTND